MKNLLAITPFLRVHSLGAAVRFFTDTLGFETAYRVAGYAFIKRDAVAFRIVEDPEGAGPPSVDCRIAYYVDVHDVERLYVEIKAKLDELPKEDVWPPHDQPYGQRELWVRVPDGKWLAFGQAIEGFQACD